jgi:hypothetical protein
MPAVAHTGPRHKTLWRLAPSLTGAAVYACFALAWRFHYAFYLKLLAAFDTLPNFVPFGDATAVLSALSCAHQGVDVYVRNACMHGGQYNYSTFLLHMAVLWPWHPAQGIAAGLFTGAVVLAALALLPPPQSRRELMLRVAVMGSSTLVDAFESANIDNLIFVAVLCAVLALRHGAAGRLAGYAMFAVLGAIKFYPAILLALIMREARHVFWAICFAGLVFGAIYAWRFGAGLIDAIGVLPAGPPYNYMFGAQNLAAGFAVMFGAPRSPLIPPATSLLALLALALAWRESKHYGAAVLAIGETERLLLLAGGMIMVECFLLIQNYDYRGLFFLLTLPGLFAMARAAPRQAGTFTMAALAVVFLMWEPLIRYLVAALAEVLPGDHGVLLKMAFWLLREFIWWRICIFLAAVVFAYVAARVPALLPTRRAA